MMRSPRFRASPLPLVLLGLYLLLLLAASLRAGSAPKPGNVYRVLADAEGDTVWVMPVITPAIRWRVEAGDAKMLTKGAVLMCPVKYSKVTATYNGEPLEIYKASLVCKDGLHLALTGIALE